jgi:hypothetical protein
MSPASAAADTETPLSTDEQLTLEKLLVRASASQAPTARIGEPYEALTCLSVPRRGDKDRGADLVYPGETVYLTDEEAAKFARHGSRDGRQVPVIRKLSGPEGSHGEVPLLLPRHVSGRLFRPPPPMPGMDTGARPDPPASSYIQVVEDGMAPEAGGAMTADPSEMADVLRSSAAPDALDLPPRGKATRR